MQKEEKSFVPELNVIAQFCKVPVPEPATSATANVHVPPGVENKSLKKVVVEGNPVGCVTVAALGRNEPVKGAVAEPMEADAVELMTVLTKLLPELPTLFARLSTCPLGALRFMTKSWSNGC